MKKKLNIPGAATFPNTYIIMGGALLGLAIILLASPKEEIFEPAYKEKVSVTQDWNENEQIVLAGTVENTTENELEVVPKVTDIPVKETDAKENGEGPKEKDPLDVKEPEENLPPVVEEPEQPDDPVVKPEEPENEEPKEEPEENTDVDVPETVIHFTENVTKEEQADTKPEEKPETADDTNNKDKKPEYEEDEIKTADEDGHPGQVYDPVFGWIVTGEVVSDNVDNDGSLDKQVGTMGKN
ncbi:MAG: hypothetical protein J6J44_12260 [Lachnospiraceae bacterium]|nr:hypothetical protein [Lachnospiraceae bacterium]